MWRGEIVFKGWKGACSFIGRCGILQLVYSCFEMISLSDLLRKYSDVRHYRMCLVGHKLKNGQNFFQTSGWLQQFLRSSNCQSSNQSTKNRGAEPEDLFVLLALSTPELTLIKTLAGNLSENRPAWPEWTSPVFSLSCMLKHNNRWCAAAASNSLRKWRL